MCMYGRHLNTEIMKTNVAIQSEMVGNTSGSVLVINEENCKGKSVYEKLSSVFRKSHMYLGMFYY